MVESSGKLVGWNQSQESEELFGTELDTHTRTHTHLHYMSLTFKFTINYIHNYTHIICVLHLHVHVLAFLCTHQPLHLLIHQHIDT